MDHAGTSGTEPETACSDPAAIELESGSVIGGKYRVIKQLGTGGMGSVWLAHNQTLDIQVAIKVLRTNTGKTPKEVAADRMLREARAAARLIHPAIVRINDYGRTEQGDPYLVMEWLDGIDLGSALDKRGRIGAVKSVRTLLPIMHALGFAHDREVVHRDVKPENIFLCRTDEGKMQPKLIDFGVARLDEGVSHRLTSPGAMMGSPAYMAPEQARGKDADSRADIWAISVVLYEMVTGRPPFVAENLLALVRTIVEDEAVPIREYGVGDEGLWNILRQGLSKSPSERWQRADELGVALAQWLASHGVGQDITGASLAERWWPSEAIEKAEDVFESVPPPSHEISVRSAQSPDSWGSTPGSWPGIPARRSSLRANASDPARTSGPISDPATWFGSTRDSLPSFASINPPPSEPSSKELRTIVDTQPIVVEALDEEAAAPDPPPSKASEPADAPAPTKDADSERSAAAVPSAAVPSAAATPRVRRLLPALLILALVVLGIAWLAFAGP